MPQSLEKFHELVEVRMAQFEESLRRFEPLARNYNHEEEDVKQIITYMRHRIDNLENLFQFSGKKSEFSFREKTLPNPTSTSSDLEIPPKPAKDGLLSSSVFSKGP